MIVLDDLFDYRRSRRRFGVEIQTPNLDRLAARGTTFGNAFCSIAVCNASRSSALSGLSPLQTQIHQAEPTQFFDTLTEEDTLMSRMQDAGYRVFGTGSDQLTGGPGNDRFRFPSGEERDVVTDFTFGEDTIWLHSETNIHGLSPLQITDYLIPVGNNVLIIDNANSRMLIQNATIPQVRNSFEHE